MQDDETAPELYEYLDGVAWLSDWWRWWREQRRRNTLEHFADRAGVAKSNLANVLARKRLPTPATLEAYNLVLGLDLARLAFLGLLFERERARNHDERMRVVSAIQERQVEFVNRTRPAVDGGYLDAWENVVLREAARRSGIPDDPASVAALFRCPVDPTAVGGALEWLRSRRLLVPGPDGELRADRDAFVTGPSADGVRALHHRALAEAGRAIEHVNRDERDLSLLVLGLRRADLPQLKAEIRALLERLATFADSAPPEEVYQLTVQVLPILTLKA